MGDKAFSNTRIVTCLEDDILPMDQTPHNSLKDEDVEASYPYSHDVDVTTLDKHQLNSYLDVFTTERSRKPSLCGNSPNAISSSVERYVFYSAELGSVKKRTLQELFLTRLEENQISTIAEILLDTTGWWIDILAPTNQEMADISKIFKIHPLTTENIQKQEAREKCEILNHYVFVSFQSYHQEIDDAHNLKSAAFYILVFEHGVLTFRFEELTHPDNVRKRIHKLKDYIEITPDWINYALIDDITDHFAPLIQILEIEADSMDDLVFILNESEQSDMVKRLAACRKIVIQLIRLLTPKADVIRGLIKRSEDKMIYTRSTGQELTTQQNGNKLHNDVVLYLADIQDHIITMLQNANHCDLVLGRAQRSYMGKIAIELSEAGNSANAVVNRLTYFATIVVPMNLVTGLFGMNVKVPGSSNPDLVWFYWILLGMSLYAVFIIGIGRRNGFI